MHHHQQEAASPGSGRLSDPDLCSSCRATDRSVRPRAGPTAAFPLQQAHSGHRADPRGWKALATSTGVWAHVGTPEGPEVWPQEQSLRVPEKGLAPVTDCDFSGRGVPTSVCPADTLSSLPSASLSPDPPLTPVTTVLTSPFLLLAVQPPCSSHCYCYHSTFCNLWESKTLLDKNRGHFPVFKADASAAPTVSERPLSSLCKFTPGSS